VAYFKRYYVFESPTDVPRFHNIGGPANKDSRNKENALELREDLHEGGWSFKKSGQGVIDRCKLSRVK